MSSAVERLRCGFDSLISQVPFWLQQGQQEVMVGQLVKVLELLQVGTECVWMLCGCGCVCGCGEGRGVGVC